MNASHRFVFALLIIQIVAYEGRCTMFCAFAQQ